MTIYIIRHAEPDYARDSLTEKGWREAELLSHRQSARHRFAHAQSRRENRRGPALAARV